jgi:tRNA pseudouridine38-40 synthase
METMRTIRLVVEYDGTRYHGWQSQRGGGTVQQAVEAALGRLTGEDARVLGAGRTDAGVHALGQVAAFRTRSALPTETISRALNALLPGDIRVREAGEAPVGFHPRFDSRGKSYFYLIAPGAVRPPVFVARYVWCLRARLDLAAMDEALRAIRGTHDFAAFMAAGSEVKGTVRTLREASVSGAEGIAFMGASLAGPLVRVRFEGDGFLRHMVRNIVGTLVLVGTGRLAPGAMGEVLRSRDRREAGPTAPAPGLFLEAVRYES